MEKEPKNINPETFLSNAGITVKGIYIDAEPIERKSDELSKEGIIFEKPIVPGSAYLGE